MLKSLAALLVLAAASAAPSFADPLQPGVTLNATPLSFGGSLCCLAPIRTGSIAIGSFSFDYTTYVFTGDSNSPFGTDALDFAYKFSNTGASSVNMLEAFDFGSYLLNVGFQDAVPKNSPQIDPDVVSRSANGNLVSFHFGVPGQTDWFSDLLLIQTNALNFTTGTVRLDGKDVSADVVGYIPAGPTTAPIPEPSSLVLLGSGLVIAASLLRRKSASAV